MDVRGKASSKKRLIDYYYLAEKIECPGEPLVYWYDIEAAPTVDAVTVVRCRECKYWGDEDGKLQDSDGVLFARCKVHNYLLDGRHTGWCPRENDFCSYGERKEGDD